MHYGSLFELYSSLGFDKCIMSCIHRYNIIQNCFITLKCLCVSPIHSSLPLPKPLETTDLFTISIVLPFPDCHTEWLYHFAFSPAINESFCCSFSLSAFGIVGVLDFSHSNRCVMVSHCCFNLRFPNDMWCWASFHVYLPPLHIFWYVVFHIDLLPIKNLDCFLIDEF